MSNDNHINNDNCCMKNNCPGDGGCIHGWSGPGDSVMEISRETGNHNLCSICTEVKE